VFLFKTGIAAVSLTVTNDAGSNTATKSSYIIASVLKAPVTAFSAYPTSGKVSLKVQFTDKSTGSPTSLKWSFGDGTFSTQKNPAHTYSKAGKYSVTLTTRNAAGSNTKNSSGYITVKSK
jgi:PKD repeat protein